jgi:hypothetical protein
MPGWKRPFPLSRFVATATCRHTHLPEEYALTRVVRTPFAPTPSPGRLIRCPSPSSTHTTGCLATGAVCALTSVARKVYTAVGRHALMRSIQEAKCTGNIRPGGICRGRRRSGAICLNSYLKEIYLDIRRREEHAPTLCDRKTPWHSLSERHMPWQAGRTPYPLTLIKATL